MKLVKRHDHKVKPPVHVSRGTASLWPKRWLEIDFDRMFDQPFGDWFSLLETPLDAWMPAVNVYEEKNNIIVKAELPGMNKEQIRIHMAGDTLNLAGERKAESEGNTTEVYHAERYFGRFHRSIGLPFPVDAGKINAHYKDGILTIICPMAKAARRKEVEVKVD